MFFNCPFFEALVKELHNLNSYKKVTVGIKVEVIVKIVMQNLYFILKIYCEI